ncbi:MAG: DUF3473 domain-containing protein [Candidatus Eisenbacteria bacterium]|uniref:DUF3473 domain-containing protein n=1 Tax=Eiseniibacteriota bacterium TaxID=2212470 RepID=A0A538T582_UNCEI|nr:MAG: DUF3473 domain-containing protein [Candidatus Eisenbacteria bacterium]
MGARREPPFALSVDVEDYFQVQAFAGRVSRQDWPQYPPRVERNVERLLDLFDETGAKATFFVLGWIARRYPTLVRAIAGRGHEVASHGVSHRMLTELSPSEFRAEAVDSRLLLESSVYPIRGRRYGYPEGPVAPARIPAGKGDIAEFPLPTVPFGPLRVPVLAGAYLRLLPSWVSLLATRYHGWRGVPLAVNVHPWEIDPEQPTVGFSRLSKWTHYARLGRTEEILRRVLRSGRFAPLATRLAELGILYPPSENGTP